MFNDPKINFLLNQCLRLEAENLRLKEVIYDASTDTGLEKTAIEKEIGNIPTWSKLIQRLFVKVEKQDELHDKLREEVAILQKALTDVKDENKELSNRWDSLKPVLKMYVNSNPGQTVYHFSPSTRLIKWWCDYEKSQKSNKEV